MPPLPLKGCMKPSKGFANIAKDNVIMESALLTTNYELI